MAKVKYFNFNEIQPIGSDYALNTYVPSASQSVAAGTAMGQITSATQNAIQTITAPGSGNYFLNISGVGTTVAIAHGASDATVQAALVTLVGAGNVSVSSLAVTFQGALAGQPVPLMTDPTGAATIANTQTGRTAGYIAPYASGNSDGTQEIIGATKHDFCTDYLGNIYPGLAVGDATQIIQSLPLFVKGRFNSADLTGVDSGGLSGRGVLEAGSLTTGIVRLF